MQHRRGQSFDQAAIQDFRLFPQDTQPTVSMTDPGYQHNEQQPYVQVAQQHSMAQPGLYQDQYQLSDYSYQQQQSLQQMSMDFAQDSYPQMEAMQSQQSIANDNLPNSSPLHYSDERELARKAIVERIEEFNKRFGNDGQPNLPSTPPRPAVLPTPPSTIQKPARPSIDVAPMPTFTDASQYVFTETAAEDSTSFTVPSSDHGYQTSYQSSLSDPMSPTRSSVTHQTPPMPPLFEEPVPSTEYQPSFPDHSTLLASSSQTALDLGICFSPTRVPLSPRSALVQNPELNASIEETGIKPEEVQAFISEQGTVDGKWTCLYENCGKKFGRRENIKSHVQTHLGDRQYKCNECQKCFVRQHDLKRHAKIHTGDKPHKCLCGNGFNRHDALTRHRQRGMCIGALPGCHRRDAKRGRPKKQRPDMRQRVDKANRARQLDNLTELELEHGYYSSSSCSDGSQVSDVVTPPDSNVFDSTHYIDMQGFQDDYAIFPTLMEETPPTSEIGPPSAKTSDSYDITSTSNEFENLSVAAGISPEMLTLSSPLSYPVSSSPPQDNIDNSDSSNKGSTSPGHASATDVSSDGSSVTSTPSPMLDDFDHAMRELDKNTNFDDAMLVTPDNFGGFETEFNAEAALEANLNEWLQNVPDGEN